MAKARLEVMLMAPEWIGFCGSWVAVFSIAWNTWSAWMPGTRARIRAAWPETKGADMDVPAQVS